MERSISYHYSKAPPRPSSAAIAAPASARLRGVIVELEQTLGTGLIEQDERRFSFRAIDIVGNLIPQIGDQVSFIQLFTGAEERAGKVVLDRDPHYIPGQSTLRDCYQTYTNQRAAKRVQPEQSATQPPGEELAQGIKYRRCDHCQKLVQPKLLRKRRLRSSGKEQWLSVCPLCRSPLDETLGVVWRHPLLLMVGLAALFSWWRW